VFRDEFRRYIMDDKLFGTARKEFDGFHGCRFEVRAHFLALNVHINIQIPGHGFYE